MVFWILGLAVIVSVVGFTFLYKLAMNDKSDSIDPKPKGCREIMKKLLIGIIRIYQKFISPLSPPSCRFYPTCSHYGLEAVAKTRFHKGQLFGSKENI